MCTQCHYSGESSHSEQVTLTADSDPESDVEEESMSDRETVTENQLVEESLVEEVSIDGMCGVY